ncbi:receptor-like serine/threonine-protein kinase NCRK [Rhododendron vialii]|uniref:receptor-like serine/threonine-protein kinase NCRK n=1 Tax=Rhododendron vialii TaxID=182163 RepID=UPI00265E0E30|nr:receptor-like serine/threonine-protein kinase NCRK [Rhododendron vialii]
MVTGKSPMTTGDQGSGNIGEMEQRGLVKWVREKMNGTGDNELWLEEIIDPMMKGKCDLRKMGILVQVAMECVVEDKDAKPTMSQVKERLLPH